MIWIYMVIPLTCCGLHLLTGRVKDKQHFYLIPAIMLILLAGLRHSSVGVDIPGYVDKFIEISKCEWENLFLKKQIFSHYEPGYIILNKCISLVTKSEQLFLLIMALLVYLPVCVLYYRNTQQSFLALCLYICIPSFVVLFSGLRQAIATSFIIGSFQYIKEKKLIKFLFWVAVASLFHQTSLCFLLAYPLYHLRLKKDKYPVVFVLLLLVFLGRNFLLKYLFNFAIFINDKYESYEIANTSSYTMIAVYLLLLCFSLLFCKDSKNMISLRNLFLMVIFFQFFASIQTNVARLGYYYLIFFPLYIVQCFEDFNIKEIWARKLIISIVMTVFFLVGWLLISGAGSMQLEYKFFWG